MNERPLGYSVSISVSDSEGNTADFTLSNTKRGVEVVAACDFPVPNDALANSLATAAQAVVHDKRAAESLDKAVAALHVALVAKLKRKAAPMKEAALDDAEAPF